MCSARRLEKPFLRAYKDVKKVRGGYLLQDVDINQLYKSQLQIVTEKKPTEEQMAAYEEDLKESDWGHQPC